MFLTIQDRIEDTNQFIAAHLDTARNKVNKNNFYHCPQIVKVGCNIARIDKTDTTFTDCNFQGNTTF